MVLLIPFLEIMRNICSYQLRGQRIINLRAKDLGQIAIMKEN